MSLDAGQSEQRPRRGAQAVTDEEYAWPHGLRVLVSETLPVSPSDGEVGRRIVRHGMADVLAWLGEDVGPMPTERTHAIQSGGWLFVSQELRERLGSEP